MNVIIVALALLSKHAVLALGAKGGNLTAAPDSHSTRMLSQNLVTHLNFAFHHRECSRRRRVRPSC